MSAIVLFVVLLLVLVSVLFLGALGYLVHRYPSLAMPFTVVLAGAAFLGALFVGIAQAAP
ncbi:hypothetical protein GCM10010145_68780 [Streptomyces ruber]|uniref:Uncharacterized protein n=2 Tax=Streptomyces TaxID=1883 RepID=A0A918BSL0_9ACTN|nr:hypothetical protein [Streptomyces ruber]GGQ89507.1 hypothetical protein GCM10010145_68780 [Streptomyces ruber]